MIGGYALRRLLGRGARQHGEARVEITDLRRQGRTAGLTRTVTALDGKVNLHNGPGNGTGQDAACVCSGTQGQFLEKGEASTLYAVFAAPPAGVTKVDVEMPTFGMITDVPLS
ncbi:hypothetical protein [Nonomuraea sp. NPDC050783]|uniref:hypothetical protein n=1 Tax=Nonomuraea sp. NPDC050783 TaxID=3154634 RepID=UPI003467890D